jgi:hypothetical protein
LNINNMKSTTLNNIKGNKSSPCVTVIIPTHKTFPERTIDPIEVNKTIKQVKDNLLLKYGKKGAELAGKLEEFEKSIDYTHNAEGLGLFVSAEISEIVQFPFPVIEKTIVGDKFETRDLVYLSAYLEDYLLLSISMDETKLYRGSGTELKEIRNNDFPRKYIDDYEYERPSLEHHEKDKSIITEERFERFLHETDKLLSPYLDNNHIPLIIAGVKQELGYFQKESTHTAQIADKIVGNYTHSSLTEFGKMAFERIIKHREKITQQEIEKLSDSIGKELAVTGIRSVWKAAMEGKGLLLMVEKDFTKPGFVKRDDNTNLYLTPPVENHNIMGDAVETIMETILEKNGKIRMVDNGTLTDHDQIALILRYQ